MPASVNYSALFTTPALSWSAPGSSHNFGHAGLRVQLWDNASPRRRIYAGVTLTSPSFDVLATFTQNQTGTIVIGGNRIPVGQPQSNTVHTFATPAQTWNIAGATHGMGHAALLVDVYDALGNLLPFADVTLDPSTFTLQVTHAQAETGYVVVCGYGDSAWPNQTQTFTNQPGVTLPQASGAATGIQVWSDANPAELIYPGVTVAPGSFIPTVTFAQDQSGYAVLADPAAPATLEETLWWTRTIWPAPVPRWVPEAEGDLLALPALDEDPWTVPVLWRQETARARPVPAEPDSLSPILDEDPWTAPTVWPVPAAPTPYVTDQLGDVGSFGAFNYASTFLVPDITWSAPGTLHNYGHAALRVQLWDGGAPRRRIYGAVTLDQSSFTVTATFAQATVGTLVINGAVTPSGPLQNTLHQFGVPALTWNIAGATHGMGHAALLVDVYDALGNLLPFADVTLDPNTFDIQVTHTEALTGYVVVCGYGLRETPNSSTPFTDQQDVTLVAMPSASAGLEVWSADGPAERLYGAVNVQPGTFVPTLAFVQQQSGYVVVNVPSAPALGTATEIEAWIPPILWSEQARVTPWVDNQEPPAQPIFDHDPWALPHLWDAPVPRLAWVDEGSLSPTFDVDPWTRPLVWDSAQGVQPVWEKDSGFPVTFEESTWQAPILWPTAPGRLLFFDAGETAPPFMLTDDTWTRPVRWSHQEITRLFVLGAAAGQIQSTLEVDPWTKPVRWPHQEVTRLLVLGAAAGRGQEIPLIDVDPWTRPTVWEVPPPKNLALDEDWWTLPTATEPPGPARRIFGTNVYSPRVFGRVFGGLGANLITPVGWIKPQINDLPQPKRLIDPYTFVHQSGQLPWVTAAFAQEQAQANAALTPTKLHVYPQGVRSRAHYADAGGNAATLTAREAAVIAVAGWRQDALTPGLPPVTRRSVVHTPIDFGWISRVQPPPAFDQALLAGINPEKGGLTPPVRAQSPHTFQHYSANSGWEFSSNIAFNIIRVWPAIHQEVTAEYPARSRRSAPILTQWEGAHGWMTPVQQAQDARQFAGIDQLAGKSHVPPKSAWKPLPQVWVPNLGWIALAARDDFSRFGPGIQASLQPMRARKPWPYSTLALESGTPGWMVRPALAQLTPRFTPVLSQMHYVYPYKRVIGRLALADTSPYYLVGPASVTFPTGPPPTPRIVVLLGTTTRGIP